MKHILTAFICFLFLLSCQKEFTNQKSNEYMQRVQASLKDSLASNDYSSLDFSRAVQSKVDSVGFNFLRVPFKNKKFENDFVIVQTDEKGNVRKGKIVHLEGTETEYGEGKVKRRKWDGQVSISSLARNKVLNSSIENGFITSFHPQANSRNLVVEPPPNVLPEVVITYIIPSSETGISWSTWVSLQSFFYDSGTGGNWWSYYGSMTGSGSGGGSTGPGNNNGNPNPGGGVPQEPPIQIDYELQGYNDAIDIEKYLACFDAVPDAGATASVTIFTDIPVDGDPRKLIDLGTAAPGHVFVNITKENGTQRVSQSFGWYPTLRTKASLTNAPTNGKFVDNEGHEFNASFKMDLSMQNLQRTLTEIRYLARFIRYDVDEYNCTDFAMDVFNASRSDKLIIPLYDIPGGITAAGTSTPNGVYIKLHEMRAAGHPESNNMTTDIIKGWMGGSSGPCN